MSRSTIARWSVVFLAARLLVLFSAAPEINSHDELYAGAAALEIAAGRGLPLPLMAHVAYCGGPLVIGALARPLFDMLGQNIVALRLPSVLMATLTAGLWIWIAGRLFGRRAAHLTGLLMVLAPPFWARLTIMAWGNHVESTLPGAVACACLVALHAGDDGLRPWDGRATARIALSTTLGLALGLSLFFSYAALVYTVAIGLVMLLLGVEVMRSWATVATVVGAALGALPAIGLHVAWQSRGLADLAPLARPSTPAPWQRALDLTYHEARHYLAPHLELTPLIEATTWAAAIAAISYGLWRLFRATRPGHRVAAEALVVLPVVVFIGLYSLSSFPLGPRSMGFFGYRYLALATPPLLVAIAALLTRLSGKAAWIAVTLLVAPNVAHEARRLPRLSGYALEQDAASYYAYGIKVFETLGYELSPTLALIEPIEDPADRTAALRGVGFRHVAHHFTVHGGDPADTLLWYVDARLPDAGPHRALFAERLAWLFSYPDRWQPSSDHVRELARRADVLTELAPVLSSAIVGSATFIESTSEIEALVVELSASTQEAGWRALGAIARRRQAGGAPPEPGPPRAPSARWAYHVGAGHEWARARLTSPNPVDPTWLATLVSEDEAGARAGVAEALASFEPEDFARRRLVSRLTGLGWDG